jgi:hypothetical protein
MERIKNWSEIEPKGGRFDGEQIPDFKTLVGKNFIVRQFKEVESDKYQGKGFLVIQLEMDSKLFTAITGSSVLRDQLKKHANDMPFKTTLAYVNNRYYSFSEEKKPA